MNPDDMALITHDEFVDYLRRARGEAVDAALTAIAARAPRLDNPSNP